VNSYKLKPLVRSLAIGGLLLVGLFLLMGDAFPTARAAPGDLFATPNGTGDCSQATPCDLQTALAQATDGNTIYLAGGTYTGTGAAVITVTRSITLCGGWDGDTTTPPVRDPDNHPSVLDGEGQRRVAHLSGPATVVLDGVTIANGKVLSSTTPWQGAGLYARGVTLTLRYVNVYSNVIDVFDASGSLAYGGGAAVEGGSLRVERSVFRRNSNWAHAYSSGGGLSISGTLTATVSTSLFQENDAWSASGLHFIGGDSPLLVSDCAFEGNGWGHSPGSAFGGYAGAMEIVDARAHLVGNRFRSNRANNDYGAVSITYSKLDLERNIITGTECARTSGLRLYYVAPFTLTNNIIADNRSTYYWFSNPAVRIEYSTGRLLQNTIARNRNFSGSHSGVGYGFLLIDDSTVWMTNTILVSHTVGISVTAGSTAALEGTLWGTGPWANRTDWGGDGTVLTGTVNVRDDPGFVDPDAGDYHIGPGSAAIGAGVDAGVTTDIDGEGRIGAPDIGADEYVAHIHLPLTLRSYP